MTIMQANTTQETIAVSPTELSWLEPIRALGKQFATRAVANDETDGFVYENYVDLKAHGFVSAGVPKELGGGGLSHAELCNMLYELAQYCSSTALALSMHTHQVAVAAWRWQHQNAPVEGLLKRVLNENIILLSSGGSDWLQGSGTATRVEGGFLINARKAFASGAPVGDLLMTSAVYDDLDAGATVLHFAVPMHAPGVTIDPVWKTIGMRGTGSHDVILENVFIPDGGIAGKRPQGKWHPLFHIISMIAIPTIYAVYVGVAKAARDRTLQQVCNRPQDSHLAYLMGGLDNELTAAQLALQYMITTAAANQPGFETTNQIMTGRTLVARAVLNVVDLAMEVTGGSAFYRSRGIEQLLRDAQGARYHPLREADQRRLAGQWALGWTLDHTT